ncbi:MAG: hypothetical protein ACTSUE_23500, partial [Promethearchaeota archaeon]
MNDFTVLDDIQGELESGGASFKKISLMDVFRSELLRLQLGFHDYTGIEKMFQFTGGNRLAPLQRDKLFYPTAANVSYVMSRIPPVKL